MTIDPNEHASHEEWMEAEYLADKEASDEAVKELFEDPRGEEFLERLRSVRQLTQKEKNTLRGQMHRYLDVHSALVELSRSVSQRDASPHWKSGYEPVIDLKLIDKKANELLDLLNKAIYAATRGIVRKKK